MYYINNKNNMYQGGNSQKYNLSENTRYYNNMNYTRIMNLEINMSSHVYTIHSLYHVKCFWRYINLRTFKTKEYP